MADMNLSQNLGGSTSAMHEVENSKPLVRCENVWKKLGGNDVLKGINLEVGRGEVVSLLGSSGAGKSTLLRCINAIEYIDRGLVYVDDVPVGCEESSGGYMRVSEQRLSRQRADIGMVFQNFNLFPHMSVLQNIIDAPVRVRKEKKSDAIEHAHELIKRVGLPEKANAYPRHLSGGQQQRIAIARALAMRPKLMLFDEPTSALDPYLTNEVLDVIKDLAQSGMTMIIVTHEVRFAREVSDKTTIMGNGKIIEAGDTEQVFSSPSNPIAQDFLSNSL
nr:amino acid ABC transporter ATP-binding protein [Roseovarius pacificus]